MFDLILKFASSGTSWITAAVLLWLLLLERKRSNNLAHGLYELGKEVVKSNGEINMLLAEIQHDIKNNPKI